MSASADASSASEITPLSCSRRSEVHSGPLGTVGAAAGAPGGAAGGAGVAGGSVGGCVVASGDAASGFGAGSPEASGAGAGAGCAEETCATARSANVAVAKRTNVVMYSSCLQQGCP